MMDSELMDYGVDMMQWLLDYAFMERRLTCRVQSSIYYLLCCVMGPISALLGCSSIEAFDLERALFSVVW